MASCVGSSTGDPTFRRGGRLTGGYLVSVDLSVVIPALNEERALPGLLDELAAVCEGLELDYELLVVDDGSTDGTFGVLSARAATEPRLGIVRLRQNFGKSEALAVGIARTTGDVVVTIDGDGQDDPNDLPRLLEKLSEGYGVVSGWKRDRQDPASRRLASRWFNRFTARATGLDLHDMNCGFKAYDGECARSIKLYGEMHRFMPALAAQNGWKAAEVPVNHRARAHGKSRFGLERYLRGAMDLLTVTFLGRYQTRPLHFFGGLGLGFTALGTLICVYLTIIKLGGEPIGQRPLLFLGVLLIVVGVQLLTLGLLGQLLVVTRRGEERSSEESAHIEDVAGWVTPEGGSVRPARASSS